MSRLYLVSGAAGHVGSAVVRELLSRGERVRALVLKDDPATKELPQEVELTEGDLLNPETLDSFFANTCGEELYLIHCAGIVSTSMRFSELLFNVNVRGTKAMLERCERHKVRRLVYVSSVHAIPLRPRGMVMEELERADPAKVLGPYAKSKAQATALVQDAATRGLDASIVFPAGICGPYDYGHGHVTQLITDFIQGRMPIGIRGGYDFVDVRDVARGIVNCAEKGKRGEGYILSNRYVSVDELLAQLQNISGKPPTKWWLPVWFVRMLLPACALWYHIRRQPPMFSRYSLYTLTENSIFAHSKAARELGYTVRPFEDTLRDTVNWMHENGRI